MNQIRTRQSLILHTRVLGLCILCSCAAAFGAVADFIIVDSPQSVTLYNQFEQPLSKQEISDFLPYTPLQIISTDGRLGDGITRAIQCALGHTTFYLLQDDQGAIVGDKARIHLLKGCALLEDTVTVSRNDAVVFSPYGRDAGSAEKLPKGIDLVLLFRLKNSFYTLKPGIRPRYGWVPAASRDAWKRVRQATTLDTALSALTVSLLAKRIESANEQYSTFFNRFNQSTGKLKTPPEWQRLKGALSWRLSAPYGRTGELDESTKYLIEDLRDILIGKPFSVSFDKGELSIVAKALP